MRSQYVTECFLEPKEFFVCQPKKSRFCCFIEKKSPPLCLRSCGLLFDDAAAASDLQVDLRWRSAVIHIAGSCQPDVQHVADKNITVACPGNLDVSDQGLKFAGFEVPCARNADGVTIRLAGQVNVARPGYSARDTVGFDLYLYVACTYDIQCEAIAGKWPFPNDIARTQNLEPLDVLHADVGLQL